MDDAREIRQEDAISRQAAIDACDQSINLFEVVDRIKELPSVNPQEPCEDEYIKVPKKALKYRTTGMVAYNAEWLKNNFDIERIAICGEQQPCEDAISRQAVLDGLASIAKAKAKSDAQKSLMGRVMFFVEQLPSVNPQPCEDAIRRQDVLDLAKKGVLVSNGNYESVCKAINELPSVNLMPCEDSISRQAVLETIDSRIEQIKRDAVKINKSYSHLSFAEGVHDGYCRLKCDLRILPPVTPQPKIGHWIVHEKPHGIRYLECPYCNIWYLNEHLIRNSYCPNCGARMIEPQERRE